MATSKTGKELKSQLAAIRELVSHNTKLIEQENELLRISRKRTAELEKDLDVRRAELAQVTEQATNTSIALNTALKSSATTKEQLKNLEEHKKVNDEIYKTKIKEYKEQEKLLKLQKESIVAVESMEDATENLVGNLTGISDSWKKGFFGQLSQTTNVAGGFRQALSNIGTGLKKTITPANVINSSFQKVQETTLALAVAQDSALASFNKATGAAGKYDKIITEIGVETRALGIDTEAAASAVMALKHEFSGFTMLSTSGKKDLAKFAATMEQFGVESVLTAKNIEFATKVMGMNVDESMTAQKELAATALALGRSPQELAEGFQAASPQLAEFGSRAMEIFEDLAEASKATGLAIESLLGIMEGFDTFEGAATKVGKLNALLGGNMFDSIEMLTAEGVDKFKLLRQGIEQSGRSFEQMGRFERKAIADAAGLKDVADLAKLMSGELERTAGASNEMGLSQEQMAEMAQKSQDVLKQLKMAAMSFAATMRPVVEWVREAAVWLAKVKDETGNLIPVIIAMTVAGWAMYKFLTAFRAIQVAIRGTTIAMTAAQGAATAAQLSKAAADVTNSVAALENAAATGTQNIAIQASGKAAKGASPALLYWAVIIGVVGTVATALTYAFAALIDSLSSFFKMLLANSDKLFKFAAQLTVLSLAMVAMGLGAIAAAPGLAALAVGFGLLSFSLALIKTEDLKALGEMFMGISKVSFQTAGALFVVAEAIRQIAEALDEVPERKAIAFAATMQSTTRTSTVAPNQNAEAARKGGRNQQAIIKQPIVIEIDGRKMGKIVLEIVNGEIQKARA